MIKTLYNLNFLVEQIRMKSVSETIYAYLFAVNADDRVFYKRNALGTSLRMLVTERIPKH